MMKWWPHNKGSKHGCWIGVIGNTLDGEVGQDRNARGQTFEEAQNDTGHVALGIIRAHLAGQDVSIKEEPTTQIVFGSRYKQRLARSK